MHTVMLLSIQVAYYSVPCRAAVPAYLVYLYLHIACSLRTLVCSNLCCYRAGVWWSAPCGAAASVHFLCLLIKHSSWIYVCIYMYIPGWAAWRSSPCGAAASVHLLRLLDIHASRMYVIICKFQVEQYGAQPPLELLRQFIYYACLIYTHQECM